MAIKTPQDPINPHDVILAFCFGKAGVVRQRWDVSKGSEKVIILCGTQ